MGAVEPSVIGPRISAKHRSSILPGRAVRPSPMNTGGAANARDQDQTELDGAVDKKSRIENITPIGSVHNRHKCRCLPNHHDEHRNTSSPRDVLAGRCMIRCFRKKAHYDPVKAEAILHRRSGCVKRNETPRPAAFIPAADMRSSEAMSRKRSGH